MDDASTGVDAGPGETPPGVLAIEAFIREAYADEDTTGIGTAESPPAANLSQREVDVLGLLATGKSNQEIADALVISRNTVLRHVNHIFDKTGASNRVEATSYAHRKGLV